MSEATAVKSVEAVARDAADAILQPFTLARWQEVREAIVRGLIPYEQGMRDSQAEIVRLAKIIEIKERQIADVMEDVAAAEEEVKRLRDVEGLAWQKKVKDLKDQLAEVTEERNAFQAECHRLLVNAHEEAREVMGTDTFLGLRTQLREVRAQLATAEQRGRVLRDALNGLIAAAHEVVMEGAGPDSKHASSEFDCQVPICAAICKAYKALQPPAPQP